MRIMSLRSRLTTNRDDNEDSLDETSNKSSSSSSSISEFTFSKSNQPISFKPVIQLDNYHNETNNSNNNQTNRSAKNGAGLSSKELKTKLIEMVKNKGIYDSMKSQLRNKLALELNTNIEQTKNKTHDVTISQKTRSNLALNTVNCLLINHLKSYEYDYTLSVFMPECGINLNEVYSLTDILHILKVSPESKLYSDLTNSSIIKSKGLLWHLVNYFCSHYVTHEVGTQTDYDGIHNIASTLDFKLKNLDKHYSNLADNYTDRLSFEDKISFYQKKIEDKVRTDYEQKLSNFKEIEISRIRNEEREKLRIELQSYRNDLENTYKKRNEMLNQKEQSFEEMLKHKRELDERELYTQRQNLLDELKKLREREDEFNKMSEFQLKFSQADSTKIEKYDEELKRRELKLKNEEADLENRLRSEKERIKLDLERSYAQREFLLKSIETKNKQEASQIELERSHLDRLKNEFQSQQMRLNEIELELEKNRGESMVLRQENALLKEKLTSCLDYEFIKQENRMLKHKLEISKELIGENHLLKRKPNSYGLDMNNENSHQIQTSIAGGSQQQQQQHQQSQQQSYVPQRKRSVTFASEDGIQLNELSFIPKYLSKDDDNSVMLATEMGADQLPKDFDNNNQDEKSRASYKEEGDRILSDAIERSQLNDKLEHHNLVNQEIKDLYEMQIYEQRKLQETIEDVKKQVEFMYYGISLPDENLYQKNLTKTSDSSLQRNKKETIDAPFDSSFGFIEGAKDRLRYLEGENERIEQNYRDYQHKLKSKYYPLDDDNENEIKIVTQKKNNNFDKLDVEKFFESTLKASISAKVMREELEKEMVKDLNIKEETKSFRLDDIRSVEELIKNMPLPMGAMSNNTENLIKESDSIRNELLKDQIELKQLQENNRLSVLFSNKDTLSLAASKAVDVNSSSTKSNNLLKKDHLDDSIESTAPVNLLNKEASNRVDVDEPTFNSELNSKKEENLVENKKNFNLNEYVKMFEKNKPDDDENEKPQETRAQQRRVQIEYSDTSTSDDLSSSTQSTKKDFSLNNKKQNANKKFNAGDDDDDDDFKW